MKSANDLYALVGNASTFAVIAPGEYYLDKPLKIPQKASSAGVFRLICTGSTFWLSSAFASSSVPLYIEGGTFHMASHPFFVTAPSTTPTVTFQGSLIVAPSVSSDFAGVFWHCAGL